MHVQRVVVLLSLVATAQQCFCPADQLQKQKNVINSQTGSSLILPVSGNVYPKGYSFRECKLAHNQCVCVNEEIALYKIEFLGVFTKTIWLINFL